MTDTSAFEAFVCKHQDRVFGIAVRLLGDEAEAEDVSQTVFLKAFERFERLGSNPSAGGWLRTVTTNLCLNHLSRYRARWRLFSQRSPDADRNRTELRRASGCARVPVGGPGTRRASMRGWSREFAGCRLINVCRLCCFISKIRVMERSPESWVSPWPRSRPTSTGAARLSGA